MSALDYNYGASSYSENYETLKPSKHNKTGVFFQGSVGLCAGQMLAGVLIALLAFLFLFDVLLMTGLVIGVVLCGAGAIGIVGSMKKNRDLINFHVVGAILGILLCTEFSGQIWREVSVDCALSELFVKTSFLEELSQNLAHHDVFSSVHDRLNELEDAIEIVHFGMDQTVQYLKENPSGNNVGNERNYIKRKLNVIRHHAMTIVDEIKKNPETSTEAVKKWSSDDRMRLQSKLNTAEHILDRIARHDEDDRQHAFSSEEYERMLNALISVIQMPTIPGKYETMDLEELNKLSEQLEGTKGIINKVLQSSASLEQLTADTDSMSVESRDRRDRYAKEFTDHVLKAQAHTEKDMTAHALHYMPEHCVKERKGMRYLGWLCLLSACLQLCTIYLSLCVSFRIPVKVE